MPPSELDKQWFYWAEMIMDEYQDYIEKENENEKKRSEELNLTQQKMPNMNDINKLTSSFKTPEIPKFNIPKF